MPIGRWIGPGMTVGWHSFTPAPRLPVAPKETRVLRVRVVEPRDGQRRRSPR